MSFGLSLDREQTKKKMNIEIWQVQQWRHTIDVELNECDLIWNTNKIFNSWCCLPAAYLPNRTFFPRFSISLCVHIKKPTILCLAENIESLLSFAFFPRKSDYKYKQSHCTHSHRHSTWRWDKDELNSHYATLVTFKQRMLLSRHTLPLSLNVTNTTHANNANERKCVNEPQNKKSREWVCGGGDRRESKHSTCACLCLCVQSLHYPAHSKLSASGLPSPSHSSVCCARS